MAIACFIQSYRLALLKQSICLSEMNACLYVMRGGGDKKILNKCLWNASLCNNYGDQSLRNCFHKYYFPCLKRPQSVLAKGHNIHEVTERSFSGGSFHSLLWPVATTIENSHDREILVTLVITIYYGVNPWCTGDIKRAFLVRDISFSYGHREQPIICSIWH